MKTNTYQRQQALLQQAMSFHQVGKTEQAKAIYLQLLRLQPRHSEILRLLGDVEFRRHNLEGCVKYLNKSLDVLPGQPETHYNLAVALSMLNRHEEALDRCNKALAFKSGYAEAYYLRGVSLAALGCLEEAIASYNEALEIRPNYAKAYFKRGAAQKRLRNFEEALISFNKATENDVVNTEAYYNKGVVLMLLKRLDEALACYEKVLAIDPDYDFVLGDFLHTHAHQALWDEFDIQRDRLIEQIQHGKKVANPFSVSSLFDLPEIHKQAAEIYVSAHYPAGNALLPIAKNSKKGRIRVGYFSTDFNNHPVTHLLAGMFEQHDRSRFEIFAFALSAHQDPWRKRVAEGVDHFLDVSFKSGLEIAALARSHEIDIAVDLNGFTGETRTGIFAERAAPIQLSYIGYLGTMGAPYMDYLIADPVIIPEDKREFYSEKIAYLHSYQCNDNKQTASGRVFTRAEAGLPESGFVFCSFNNNYKITPHTFDSWMRILKGTPGSVLWLYVGSPNAIANLKKEAEKRGVDSRRLVFAGMLPLEEHLARQRLADLFLDTHPYNAGATASNALRMGLPVLTRLGESFAARVGASLLQAVGLPEMITRSPEEYEALAIQLATHPERLASLKEKLAHNLPTCALFDTARFTRNIEAAYIAMYERLQNGLPPDHIDVSAMG